MTKIYLADPQMRAEQVQAIRSNLPAGWELTDEPSGASAIVTDQVAVTPEMLAAVGPSLKLITRLDTGSATVTETEIPVVELPNTALVGVAELSVLLILALSRHLMQLNRQTLAQEWLPDRSEPILTDQKKYTYNWIGLQDFGTVYGKTAGLIGMGLIGRATAQRLAAFGMKLLYTQRNRLDPATEAQYGVEYRTLDELLAESDFVSLHHRFQEGEGGNDNHIGAREFALMKPTAYIVNTARGRLIDEDALIAALQNKTIAGAGLDVFRYEPFHPDSTLLQLAGDNVILTPHVAGAPIVEAWNTIAVELVEHTKRALAGAAA